MSKYFIFQFFNDEQFSPTSNNLTEEKFRVEFRTVVAGGDDNSSNYSVPGHLLKNPAKRPYNVQKNVQNSVENENKQGNIFDFLNEYSNSIRLVESLDVKIDGSKTVPYKKLQEAIDAANTCAIFLQKSMDDWVQERIFRPIIYRLFQELGKYEPESNFFLLIQTDNIHLQKLPWQAWINHEVHLLYPKTNIEVGFLSKKKVNHLFIQNENLIRVNQEKIKLLIIVGNTPDNNKVGKKIKQLQNDNQKWLDVTVKSPDSVKDLGDIIQTTNFSILTFICHGTESPDITLQCQNVEGMFQLRSGVSASIDYINGNIATKNGKLIIFDCCNGLRLAHSLITRLDHDNVACIAMKESISLDLGLDFLELFFKNFYEYERIDIALFQTKMTLFCSQADNRPCASWHPTFYLPSSQGIPLMTRDILKTFPGTQDDDPFQDDPRKYFEQISRVFKVLKINSLGFWIKLSFGLASTSLIINLVENFHQQEQRDDWFLGYSLFFICLSITLPYFLKNYRFSRRTKIIVLILLSVTNAASITLLVNNYFTLVTKENILVVLIMFLSLYVYNFLTEFSDKSIIK